MPNVIARQNGGTGRATVRVTEQTHTALRTLASQTGEPIQELVAKAVEAYRRQRILELTNTAYAALRENPEEWQAELTEREMWDVTLADGLGER